MEQHEAMDPGWERPVEVDLDRGDRQIDCSVRTRRLLGSDLPDGDDRYGFTLEEREDFEMGLDKDYADGEGSLSELTNHRGPTRGERAGGLMEASQSRKYLQKPHETVQGKHKEIMAMIAKGQTPAKEAIREYLLMSALDLMASSNPGARAKGMGFMEKWMGGGGLPETTGDGEDDF